MPNKPLIPITTSVEQLLELLVTIIPGAVRHACYRHHHIVSNNEFEDICQEVIILLAKDNYHQLREFRGESSIKTWLYTVVRHYVGHRLRVIRKATYFEELLPDSAICFPKQEIELLFRERIELVRRALINLSAQSQILFELSLNGFNDLEISRIIGISTDAVRKQRYYLKKKLIKLFKLTNF